ncbi:Hypothetical predicted protein [Pelobates cultripes]|uniref:Secreted protein n=1 Tax=Pelobates cultripes TaxID=61616 RepID=A0AAD1WIM9_PELCU|nr:Hypothetical predicted protein [Pelobates cultripes]
MCVKLLRFGLFLSMIQETLVFTMTSSKGHEVIHVDGGRCDPQDLRSVASEGSRSGEISGFQWRSVRLIRGSV